MARVYVGVGSNINARQNVRGGIHALQERFGELDISPVYESEPVGLTGGNFYNLVIGFDSDEPYMQIAESLHGIEAGFGRDRDQGYLQSRTLDLDLLLYGELVIKDGNLQLPRNDILEYAFVLKPLAELAGDQLHPVLKRSYTDLWRSFDRAGQKLWPVELDSE